MRSYLAAEGVDVVSEVGEGSLVLSSDQGHLANGHFDADRMLQSLEGAVNDALSDGYRGLWATGDMTWEFGSKKEFGKLLDYEWKLEDLFRRQPCLSGVCQYHIDTLPQDAVRNGLAGASGDLYQRDPVPPESVLCHARSLLGADHIAGVGRFDGTPVGTGKGIDSVRACARMVKIFTRRASSVSTVLRAGDCIG